MKGYIIERPVGWSDARWLLYCDYLISITGNDEPLISDLLDNELAYNAHLGAVEGA